MYKIIFLLCFGFGLTQSFDMKSINETISILCRGMTTQSGQATIQIDQMIDNLFNQGFQFIQQYIPRTTDYLSKSENKNKLKSGGENCQIVLNNLKTLLFTDLQQNPQSFQFIKQFIPIDI